MKSEPLVIKAIKKKTNAKVFKDLRVGDRIRLSVEAEAAGSSRGRTYATYIRTENLGSGEVVFKSFNEIAHLLDNFEFDFKEEVEC